MYIVYKTTNIINGKIYIGVHNGSNVNYLGSGKYLNDAIAFYGANSFKREVLFEFTTLEEALVKEKELVTEEFVLREDTYNLIVGGGMPPSGLNKNYPPRPDASKRMMENNPSKLPHVKALFKNTVVVKDASGNVFRVKTDDPRYLSGELSHINKGKITVQDKTGKIFSTYKDDPRYLSGELELVINSKKLKCPYCNFEGLSGHAKRWHFENCKEK